MYWHQPCISDDNWGFKIIDLFVGNRYFSAETIQPWTMSFKEKLGLPHAPCSCGWSDKFKTLTSDSSHSLDLYVGIDCSWRLARNQMCADNPMSTIVSRSFSGASRIDIPIRRWSQCPADAIAYPQEVTCLVTEAEMPMQSSSTFYPILCMWRVILSLAYDLSPYECLNQPPPSVKL